MRLLYLENIRLARGNFHVIIIMEKDAFVSG